MALHRRVSLAVIAHGTAIALAALSAALCSFLIPGPASEVTGIAAVLALSAIAALAGLRWGSLMIGVATLMLVAKVWPSVFFAVPAGSPAWWAGLFALLLSLPGLILFGHTLPSTVELVLGERGRHHGTAVALSGVGSLAWLAAPAVLG